jgi:hypothetical protein
MSDMTYARLGMLPSAGALPRSKSPAWLNLMGWMSPKSAGPISGSGRSTRITAKGGSSCRGPHDGPPCPVQLPGHNQRPSPGEEWLGTR